jgi:uncharacterized protein (UPF0332 family)
VKEKITALMQRAREDLLSAKLLAQEGLNNASVSRAYYALFYAAEAVLLTRHLKFSSHKSVISLFGQHFVATGTFPAASGKDLREAFEERLKGDYSFEPVITHEIAANALKRAEGFVETMKEYLKKKGYEV